MRKYQGGYMRKLTLVVVAAVLTAGTAMGHLCDNVYKQADKVIIKPEFTNLIVKDKSTFKVFIQNNMDRGVETAGLDGESEAFDIKITPHAMELPKAKSDKDRVSFEVAISLKPGFKSGNYRINFRLVGRDDKANEIARYSVETGGEGTGGQSAMVSSGQSVSMRKCGAAAPVVDGVMDDPCWREAASFTNFIREDGSAAPGQTVGLVTTDGTSLFVGLVLNETTKAGTDRLVFAIAGAEGGTQMIEVRPRAKAKVTAKGGKRVAVAASSKVDKKAKTWTVEMSVPLEKLVAAPGGEWKMNVVRYQGSGTKGASAWTGKPSAAGKLKAFGTLKLASGG